MATLTADQIEYIRAMSGDTCEDYDVSDTLLQKLFTRAEDDECKTVVYVLRIREAKAAVLTNESSESGQSKSLSQKHAHLRAMREDWEQRCGMSGGELAIGTLDLNLDTDCDNTEGVLWL